MNPTTLVLSPGLDGTEIFLGPLLLVHAEVASLDRFAILGWSFGGPLALMDAAQRVRTAAR
jgi:dipeptidyl aminopeptidase/acylaminoacyl peptidase